MFGRFLSDREAALLRERAASFAWVGHLWGASMMLGDPPMQSVTVGALEPGFLEMLGGAPALGRPFRPEDHEGEARAGAGSAFSVHPGPEPAGPSGEPRLVHPGPRPAGRSGEPRFLENRARRNGGSSGDRDRAGSRADARHRGAAGRVLHAHPGHRDLAAGASPPGRYRPRRELAFYECLRPAPGGGDPCGSRGRSHRPAHRRGIPPRRGPHPGDSTGAVAHGVGTPDARDPAGGSTAAGAGGSDQRLGPAPRPLRRRAARGGHPAGARWFLSRRVPGCALPRDAAGSGGNRRKRAARRLGRAAAAALRGGPPVRGGLDHRLGGGRTGLSGRAAGVRGGGGRPARGYAARPPAGVGDGALRHRAPGAHGISDSGARGGDRHGDPDRHRGPGR